MSASPLHPVAESEMASGGTNAPDASLRPGRPALLRSPVLLAAALVIAVITGFCVTARHPDLMEVQNGRRFSPAERRQSEKLLRAAGIAEIQSQGAQLLVPGESLAAADSALEKEIASRESSANRTTSANSLLDQFATGRRREQADAAERAAQLGRLLADLPGVETAEVVWDEEPRLGRRQPPRVRATVFLKPEDGSTIGLETVQAVRSAVSGGRAHLAAADVAVMDMQRKITYRGELDSAEYAETVHRDATLSECRDRISSALADIEGVQVAVTLQPAQPDQIASANSRSRPHVQFTGRSGPNLRMEVSPVPASAAATTVPTQISPPAEQLHIVVDVPPSHVLRQAAKAAQSWTAAQLRNADKLREAVDQSIESDVRNRVAVELELFALAHGQPRLTVHVAEPAANEWLSAARSAGGVPALADLLSGRTFGELVSNANRTTIAATFAVLVLAAGSLSYLRRRSVRSGSASERKRLATPRLATSFLPGADIAVWAPLVAREPSSLIAGLLPILPPEEVSHVLMHLETEQQRVVLELAPKSSLSEAQLSSLRRKIRRMLADLQKAAVVQESRTSPAPRERFVPNSAPVPFSFDDLARIDEASLQQLAARVPAETWSAALVGATPKLRKRLLAVNGLAGAPSAGPDRRPMRLREIEAAQRLIVDEWRSL